MVEWKKLGEVCTVSNGDRPISKILGNGLYPYVNAGRTNSGYLNEYNSEGNAVTTPSHGEGGIGSVQYQKEKFWCGALCYKMYSKNGLRSRYLFHFLSNNTNSIIDCKNVGGQPFINRKQLEEIPIAYPSLQEQTRIVTILDTFTSAIDNLKDQIAQRRKQYEYYRDQLLDLEGKEGVEIGSIAKFVKERIEAGKLTFANYTSVENLLKDKAGRKDAENVPSDGYWIKYQKGDVLIGNIRPYLRKIWLSDREGGTNGDVIVIRANNTLLPEYMFYCLASESFFLYYNQALKDGKMPRGEKKRVLSYVIPSVGKDDQQRIVSILDTFEASIKNLETQLVLRQKQYEYYRNKLLTFEK